LAFLSSIPQSVTVYSNHPHAIGYLLGRRARKVPLKFDPMSLLPAEDFGQSIWSMCKDVAENQAIVVFSDPDVWYLSTAEELQSSCGLALTRRLVDGVVFRSK
jgi:hypothetical protein